MSKYCRELRREILRGRHCKSSQLERYRYLRDLSLSMPHGNSVIPELQRSRIWRLERFVTAAGNLLMGTLSNLKHTSYFKHPTLFGNDLTDVPTKSETFRDLILPITFLGISVILFRPMNNEQIYEAVSDLGNEFNSLSFKKSLVHPEKSFSTNVVKPLPERQ